MAGGRRVASIYEKVNDFSTAQGLGCSTIPDQMMMSSPKEIMIGMFIVFVCPLLILIIVSTRCFTSRKFWLHPIRNGIVIVVALVFIIELSPFAFIDIPDSNPVQEQLLAKNLDRVLTGVWQGSKIPVSQLAKEFFDNQKDLKKRGKLRLNFGPRAAKADVLTKDTLYFHTDQLGSTRLITREDGSIYQYLNYMPFGKILEGVINGPTFEWDAGPKNTYTGQEYDKSTGLYFYQSRFYDADIGRFISADTVIPQPADGQTFNRYTYVNNNPFKFTDPTGHDFMTSFLESLFVVACTAIGAVVGCVIGFAVAGFMGGFAGFFLGAIAGAAIGSGIVGVYEASKAGATGSQLVGAFFRGALISLASSVVSYAVPGAGYAILGYSIYQAACSNDPDAWASLVGSIVGSFVGNSLMGIAPGGDPTGAYPSLFGHAGDCTQSASQNAPVVDTGLWVFHGASNMDVQNLATYADNFLRNSPEAINRINQILESSNNPNIRSYDDLVNNGVKINVYIGDVGKGRFNFVWSGGQARWDNVFKGQWSGQPDRSIAIASYKLQPSLRGRIWPGRYGDLAIRNASKVFIHETVHWMEGQYLGKAYHGPNGNIYDAGSYVAEGLGR